MDRSASAGADSTEQVALGRCLGEFVLREKLGHGGFGEVYLAEQPLLEREAVIKILRSRRSGDPLHVQRFLREARLASQLDHPYAAHIYAFGAEPDGLFWIAMERVRGVTLETLLRVQGPLPLERFVPLLDRICEVVYTAHRQGIVHRDLKPANVMVLSRAGRLLPKLLDFGIAKLVRTPLHGEGMSPAATGGAGDASPPSMAAHTPLSTASPITFDEPLLDPAPTGRDPATPRSPLPELTVGGHVMGSPHYMAPEQWAEPTLVDARSDIYALGALIHEALTGRHLFTAATVRELAYAHTHQPPPSLGPAFPRALDDVLARALAKDHKQRFATALEFGEAFRRAAGLPGSVAPPQLHESLRDAVIAGFPQPLAEAVARLEAARSVHQARTALRQTWRLAARYLGLLALACRTRMSMPAHEWQGLGELLRRLRRRGLSDEEWVELARVLVSPFAAQADAFPLPELVLFFFPVTPAREAPARSFESLELLESRGAALVDEEEVRHQLETGLAELGRLLEGLSFLASYPLAVRHDAGCERWMGVRRSPRVAVEAHGQDLPVGRPLLLDRADVPAVLLWPLFQVAAPAPGAPGELFLLEGSVRVSSSASSTSPARLLAWPAGLEHTDDTLWSWMATHVLETSEALTTQVSTERSPYVGLASFTGADHEFFFGREREVAATLNRLRLMPLLAIVGPSGSGKTSLVQAGLFPALPPDWQALSVRPGATPLAALHAHLEREGMAPSDLAALERRDAAAVARALRAHASRHGKTLLLHIDQFEELFTLCPDPEERRCYAEVLGEAARSVEDPVRIVLTLRDDFLLRAEQLPPLRDRLGQCLQLLATPALTDLVRILVIPAERAGYSFEEGELPFEMARAVSDQPGALALLSFTAARLWDLRDRHFRQLSRGAYEQLGGVGGALAQHAEDLLAQLTAPEQRLVREAFRHLVTGEGTRAVLERDELVRLLGGDARAGAVLERLITSRLLVATEGARGEEQVEIIHEALLAAWPRLGDWQREDREGARLRDQFRSAARQWHERGRPQGLLWRDEALTEFRLWRTRHPGPLTDIEEAFEKATLTGAAQSRRRRFGAIAAVLAALVLGLVATTLSAQRARKSEREARERLFLLYEEQGRQLMLAGDPVRALVYLNEALQGGRDGTGLRFLIARATRALAAERRVLTGHQSRVWSAQFSPDGALVATTSGDGTARLWDARTGALRHLLEGHRGEVYTAVFSLDGTRLVTTGQDEAVRVWDVGSGRQLHALTGHRGRLGPAAFSPDGRLLVTVGEDGIVLLWDSASGHIVRTLRTGSRSLRSAAFSPDGTRLVTTAWNRETLLWRMDSGTRIALLEDGHFPPEAAGSSALYSDANHAPTFGKAAAPRFSPDGAHIVVLGLDFTAKLFRSSDGARVAILGGHTRQLRSAAFSPDGAHLVTASEDRTARLWNTATGRLEATLAGHSDSLNGAFFSPDGRRIATLSDDGTARLWDLRGMPLATLTGHLGRITAGGFDPSSRLLVTAGFDNNARLWDATRRDAITLELPETSWSGVFTPDGRRLLTGSLEGILRQWDVNTGRPVSTFSLGGTAISDMSCDGRRVLVMSDRKARLFDLGSSQPRLTIAHEAGVLAAALSPDRTLIAIAAGDGLVALHDATDGRRLEALSDHGGPVNAIAFSADGTQLAMGGEDQRVRIWDVRTGQLLRMLMGHTGAVLSVAFHPDGMRLLTGSTDQTVKLWRLADGQLLHSGQAHRRQINMVAFHPAGTLFAAAGDDEQTTLWETESGNLLASLPSRGAPWIRFHPDGTRLAVAEVDPRVVLWDINLDRRRPGDLARLVRCHVSFGLEAGRLVPRAYAQGPCDPDL